MAKEPVFQSQVNEFGHMEKVDVTVYDYRVVCNEDTCLNIRYVKSQDRTIVKKCKLHSRLATLKKRADRAKVYRKNKK